MSITSKFIYAKTKAAFEAQLPSIPQNLNPIVFIEDTREMWTMGTYFSIGYPAIQVSETQGVVKVDIANSFFTISTSGASLSIQKGAGNDIIISSNALTRVDTAAPLEWDVVTKRLLHSVSGASAGTYGQSTATENASILNIPYLTVNATGHITSISTKAVSIRDYVEQLAPNELLGDRNVLISYNEANTNSDTAQVRKARGLTFNSLSQILTVGGGANINGPTNVTNGDLTVTGGDIVGNLRGNVTGEATPKIHLSLNPEYGGASKNLYGHVKLLDIFGAEAPPQSSDNSDTAASTIINGVAASPYLVWETKRVLQENIDSSLQTSKTYAESLFAANDALVFKGGIPASGIIISKDPLVNGKTIGQLTDYSAGWTFKATAAIEIAGIGKLEEGDLVISLTDSAVYSASDWTVVQTNIDGAVIAIDTLTASQLLIGDSGTKTIKTLAAGSEGQILRINSSLIPYWASPDAQTWRAIKVKGTEVLANTTSTPLDFEQGNGISLSWNSLTNAVSIAFNGDILQNTLQALTIASTSISVGSYNPTGTTDNVLNFTDGLTASLSNNIFKVGHSNSVSTQVTKAVRSFSYDAHGHITASDIVSSLPNSFALKFLSNDSATELMTYDGSELKNIRFINGSNINISPSYNALTKTIEYTISSGVTTDTWRNIYAYSITNVLSEIRSTSQSSGRMQYGAEFIWDDDNDELKLGWAEVAADGITITYSI